VTITLSLALILGASAASSLLAQDQKKDAAQADTKKDEAKAKTEDTKKDETKKDDTKKDEAKAEAAKPAEPQPSIPPEVEAKLDAARRAVAEAIVAAQDAGLVQTTIDPPPILDILINGRATDATALKGATKDNPEVGVSPEVFGAWFTGFGKMDGVDAQKNVRIVNPSKGLKDWYQNRANLLNRYIAEARKAKGEAAKPAAAPKPEETKKDEVKKEEVKKEEPKK
jgi:hypothetical protein